MDFEYDEGEHVKETFAYFGRAYYMANVFEAGLAIAIMQLDFLSEVQKKLQVEGKKAFNRQQYETDFDAFMDRQHAQSLGNLINAAKKLTAFDQPFVDLLIDVKAKRDFLAHHFFRERSVEFASRKGKNGMIEELEKAHDIFTKADRMLDTIMAPKQKELGFDGKVLQAAMDKFLRDAKVED